jgi:hypothetical protein
MNYDNKMIIKLFFSNKLQRLFLLNTYVPTQYYLVSTYNLFHSHKTNFKTCVETKK